VRIGVLFLVVSFRLRSGDLNDSWESGLSCILVIVDLLSWIVDMLLSFECELRFGKNCAIAMVRAWTVSHSVCICMAWVCS
jgi:hypothetical protein